MLLLLLLPTTILLPPLARARAGEIIGGWEAQPHSRPYMAFVKIGVEGSCRGFLIREDMEVTAAHCNCNLGNISMLLGAHNVEIDELGRQKIWVRHRIPHGEYNDETYENDIMLLQLRHKTNLTQTVGTIPLPQREVKEGAVCSVASWSWTSSKTNTQPTLTLQEVKLKVMSNNMCPSWQYLQYSPSRMLCVGDPRRVRHHSWLADSGGPLVCDGKAHDIVSYGKPDELAPQVFTKVSKYVSLIKKTLCKLKS
ncbi:mast cell protease 3-like [Natator depressus]|uniref:mast cell protease 3-like n=1 Tax=Natator depressus TaxID=27790 RepID=UPI003EB9A774